MTDDRIIDELYGLPLEDFTAARNDFVARLTKAGKTQVAREIKVLRKPTLAGWTINQLARHHRPELKKLLALRDKLSSGDAASIRSASDERKRLIGFLTERARSILIGAGHPAGTSTLEGVSKTLLAGGTDDERMLILAGRLTRELPPSGFEGIFGTASTEADELAEPELDPRVSRRAEDLDHKATQLEHEAKRLERDAVEAKKYADKAAQQAATARRKATEARSRADTALDALKR